MLFDCLAFFFFFLALSRHTTFQAILLLPQGVSLFTKALCDVVLSLSIISTLNKGIVVELCGVTYLRSGAIPLPNNTMRDHVRVLRVD